MGLAVTLLLWLDTITGGLASSPSAMVSWPLSQLAFQEVVYVQEESRSLALSIRVVLDAEAVLCSFSSQMSFWAVFPASADPH